MKIKDLPVGNAPIAFSFHHFPTRLHLKDNYGGETVRVKGHKKVFAHLMFGLIAITAKQLLKLLS